MLFFSFSCPLVFAIYLNAEKMIIYVMFIYIRDKIRKNICKLDIIEIPLL